MKAARWLIAGALLVLFDPGGPGLFAQVRASSIPTKTDATTFNSPMLLELPVDLTPVVRASREVAIPDLAKYSCEGVHIDRLVFQRRDPRVPGELRVKILVSNRGDHDKEVDVRVQLLRGEMVIAVASMTKIEAEEDDDAHEDAKMLIPAPDLDDLSGMSLRVVVVARDE